MAALKWLLAILGLVLFGSASALVVYDVYVASELRNLLRRKSKGGLDTETSLPARSLRPVGWRRVTQSALVALVPPLSQASMVVRDGNALACVSPTQGAQHCGRYPGAHRNHAVTRLVRA